MNREDYEYIALMEEYNRKRKEQEFASDLAESALAGSVNHISDNPIIQNSYKYSYDIIQALTSSIETIGDIYYNLTLDEKTRLEYNKLRITQKTTEGYITTEGNITPAGAFGEGISVFGIILFISFIFKKIYLKFFRNSIR